MTLKEKFDALVPKEFGGMQEPLLTDCEKIADDYAIEFLEWCELKMVFNPSVIHKPTYKKLLEAFKKEQGL